MGKTLHRAVPFQHGLIVTLGNAAEAAIGPANGILHLKHIADPV
jgi:hypothetical protein